MDQQTERMYELMKKESNRLKTFQMNPPWPKEYVDIKKLAKAGFFYAFNGDNVHCAFCRGQVCRWDREDDPMTEHARHFTTCPFIMGGDVGNEPLDEDPFPGPKRPRPYDVCGRYTNPCNIYIEQNHIPPTNNSLLLSTNNHRNYLHHQNDQRQIGYQTNQQIMDHQMNNQAIIHEQSQVNEQINYRNNISTSNSLIGICKVCYTNTIELVFLPCGHSVSCLSCAARLFTCPVCRETITTRIRTYLA